MSTPTLKIKVTPTPKIKGKMDVRFPANVDALSPILLDRTGGSFEFSLDMNAVNDTIGNSFQPVDADLTAIAALTTTSYGRSLLTLANATALAAEVDSFFLTPAEGSAAYQPLDSDLTAIAALTTTAYGRAFLALADAAAARAAVGLSNVDNTSDANKPVSTATQTALNLKANLASPTFTGTPAAPTAAVDTNTTQLATTAMVLAQAAAATPLGSAATASVGTSTRFARADHVHPGREVLTGNRTYYVRTDGSDSNTGLANTSGDAFLTKQKAYNVIAMLDLGGFTATIQIGDGTYTAGLSIAVSPVGGNVAIVGNTGTPGNVIISTTAARAIAVTSGINLNLSGLKLQTTTSADSLYVEGPGANVTLGAGMQFGASAGAQINVNRNGLVIFTAAYTINGSATTNHCRVQQGGQISGSTITATLTGTPSFGNTFSVESTGVFTMFSWTFSGSATGPRYAVSGNGVLNSFGSGTASTFFPGNANGTTASGGQQI